MATLTELERKLLELLLKTRVSDPDVLAKADEYVNGAISHACGIYEARE